MQFYEWSSEQLFESSYIPIMNEREDRISLVNYEPAAQPTSYLTQTQKKRRKRKSKQICLGIKRFLPTWKYE